MLLGGVWVRDLRGKDDEGYELRDKREIERIVMHHVGAGVNRDFTAAEIADYHRRVQGWPGIGYHFLAHPDGRLEYVGDIGTIRYHVGKLNGSSVGICLAGDFMEEGPSRMMLMRVKMLVDGLRRVLRRKVAVVGHRDISGETGYGWTSCPGDTWESWRGMVDR